MFENRTYRKLHRKKGLISFDITVKETNLNIQARTDLRDTAMKAAMACRNMIETYIGFCPEFATSLIPLEPMFPGPPVITAMLEAGRLAGVGPMAAVAGAVAEFTGKALLEQSSEVVVENGGDIFIRSETETVFSIYAGPSSPFSMTTGIRIYRKDAPYGLCTSSGTIGHSKSFGRADAVTVLSHDCSLADAAATGIANRIQSGRDIQPALKSGKTIPGVQGIVIMIGDKLGLWGELELIPLTS